MKLAVSSELIISLFKCSRASTSNSLNIFNVSLTFWRSEFDRIMILDSTYNKILMVEHFQVYYSF